MPLVFSNKHACEHFSYADCRVTNPGKSGGSFMGRLCPSMIQIHAGIDKIRAFTAGLDLNAHN
jgi:hypothetical protein